MFTARGISAVGAHHTGSVGVTGSNPVCSTKFKKPIVLGFEQVLGEQSSPAELAEQLVFFHVNLRNWLQKVFLVLFCFYFIYMIA